MSFWTPYLDEAPLDLSKKTAAPENCIDGNTQFSYVQYPVDYHYGFYAPIQEVSPGATSSGYGTVACGPTAHRHAALSPSMSPSVLKRPMSMVDSSNLSDDEEYKRFKHNALQAMTEKNGGTLLENNPRMRRTVRSTAAYQTDADTYRRQRERNNLAAKQSRDKRKLREIDLALKVRYLNKEVAALKFALSSAVCRRCRQSCLC